MTKIKKKPLLLTKYEHVADVVVKLYSCATFLNRAYGGLNATKTHQYLGNVCRKIALLKNFNFATSNEPNSHSF